MSAFIKLENVYVEGIAVRNIHLRAMILRKEKREKCKIKILEGINFEAKKGDRIGILGRNGAGKTSLLRAACGIYPATQGTVTTNGKFLSMLSMGAGMLPSLSGFDNIKLAFIMNDNLSFYNEDIVQKIVEFVDIGDQIHKPLSQYSSGMAARLIFASNVFQDGNILILDEIFAAGDQSFVKKAYQLIQEKMENAEIVINVSHSIDIIEKHCNTCYIMEKGRIVNFGDTKDMINEYNKIAI